MNAITISNGYKTATISQVGSTTPGSRIAFVVIGRNGGSPRAFKTLEGAKAYAARYVGL